VGNLLWFDAVGASAFGIETLPDWLERFQEGEFDLTTLGVVISETLGTVVLESESGVPPLILSRAGELAQEKARDAGIGIVRVCRLGAMGAASAVVAGMASGPMAGFASGPDAQHALALPNEEGPPAVYDSALLAGAEPGRLKRGTRSSRPPVQPVLKPWLTALVPEGDWLVLALRIDAIESLSTFLERVGVVMNFEEAAPGQLLPAICEARRRAVREQGISLSSATRGSLVDWASRLGIESIL